MSFPSGASSTPPSTAGTYGLGRDMIRESLDVAVVDDDPSILRSVERILGSHSFSVRLYESAMTFLQEAESITPGGVVADLSMPGLTGLDLQQSLADSDLRYPMVFITGCGDVRTSVQAMRAGAVDFLEKPFEPQDLISAVERALDMSRLALQRRLHRQTIQERLATLTVREREVFEQVVEGNLNKQIAANLGIAEKTVKVHRARVMRKMEVRSVAQLARLAEYIRN